MGQSQADGFLEGQVGIVNFAHFPKTRLEVHCLPIHHLDLPPPNLQQELVAMVDEGHGRCDDQVHESLRTRVYPPAGTVVVDS